MFSLDSLFLFTFVFSIILTIRSSFKFVVPLLRKEPYPVVYSNRELTLLAFAISYIITYIFQR